MPDKPENEFPKVPPFVIPGASKRDEEESSAQNAQGVQPAKSPVKNDKNLSQLGVFSSLVSAISMISMGAALISGAWFAYSVLILELKNDILPKVIIIGLAYGIGWIFSAFGIRVLGNFWLPYVIKIFSWIVLGGIVTLQMIVISNLFAQEYTLVAYIKFLALFGAGLFALIGLHLILEKHSLIPFALPILLVSLAHLYLIIYHYIFIPNVIYELIWGDIIFFVVTSSLSLLMLAHFGLLNGLRNFMDRTFNPIDNPFNAEENYSNVDIVGKQIAEEDKIHDQHHKTLWQKIPVTFIILLFALGSFLSLGGILLEAPILIGGGLIVFFLVFLVILLR